MDNNEWQTVTRKKQKLNAKKEFKATYSSVESKMVEHDLPEPSHYKCKVIERE